MCKGPSSISWGPSLIPCQTADVLRAVSLGLRVSTPELDPGLAELGLRLGVVRITRSPLFRAALRFGEFGPVLDGSYYKVLGS